MKKKNILKFVASTIVALCLTMSCFAGFSAKLIANAALPEDKSPSNNEFSLYTGSDDFVKAPSSWSVSDSQLSADYSGIVDTSSVDAWTTWQETSSISNPNVHDIESTDKNILMISSAISARFGYKSSAITLDASAYYKISVWAFVPASTTTFSFGITSGNEYSHCIFEYSAVQSTWTQYTFFVETGLTSKSSNLELWFGNMDGNDETTGTVFFDDVNVSKITSATFLADSTNEHFSDKNTIDSTYIFDNSDFEDTSKITLEISNISSSVDGTKETFTIAHDGTNRVSTFVVDTSATPQSTPISIFKNGYSISIKNVAHSGENIIVTYDNGLLTDQILTFTGTSVNVDIRNDDEVVYLPDNWNVSAHTNIQISNVLENATFSNTSISENNNILKITRTATSNDLFDSTIENQNDFYGVKSSSFAIKQYGLYRISVFARTSSSTAVPLKFSLKYKTLADKDSSYTQSQTLSATTTTNETINNWTEYVFFVRGSYLKDMTVALQIELTNEGFCYFGGINIQTINASTYSNGTHKVDFSSSSTLNNVGITNGSFNLSNDEKIYNSENDYSDIAITPADWTTFGETSYVGIVSLNSTSSPSSLDYDDFKNKLGNAVNPYDISLSATQKNVLAIYAAPDNDEYAGATHSVSLSKGVNCVSVWTKTVSDSKATILLAISDNTVAIVDNIQSTSEWKQINLYIKVAENTTATLKLSLGSQADEIDGLVFFAKATKTTSVAQSTIDALNSKSMTENKTDGNFFYDGSSDYAHKITLSDGVFADMTNYTGTIVSESGNVTGIINKNEISGTYFETFESGIIAPKDSSDVEFLVIANKTASYSSIIAKTGVTNTSTNAYLLITTKVKLLDKIDSNDYKVYVKFGDITTITLDSSKTYTTDENGWISIEAYIKVGTATIGTVTPTFSVGTSDETCTGIALFSTMSIATSTEDAYNDAKELESASIVTIDKSVTEDETEKEEEPASKKKDKVNITAIFFIVLSSVVLAGAIILALVARGVKRLPNKTHVNIKDSGIKPKSTKGGNKSNSTGSGKGFV